MRNVARDISTVIATTSKQKQIPNHVTLTTVGQLCLACFFVFLHTFFPIYIIYMFFSFYPFLDSFLVCFIYCLHHSFSSITCSFFRSFFFHPSIFVTAFPSLFLLLCYLSLLTRFSISFSFIDLRICVLFSFLPVSS